MSNLASNFLQYSLIISYIILISACATVKPVFPVIPGEQEEVGSLLLEIHSNKKDVQRKAIARLGEIGSGEQVKRELMLLFTSRDQQTKNDALKALQTLVAKERLFVQFQNYFDKHQKNRMFAIRSFLHTPEFLYEKYHVYTLLINALEDSDIQIVRVSAAVLGKRKEKRAVPTLTNLLLSPKKNTYKVEIIEALIDIGAPAVSYLVEQFGNPVWEHSSTYIAKVLFKIGEPIGYEVLSVFGNARLKQKATILTLLRYAKNEPDLDLILSYMLDRVKDIRIARKILHVVRQKSVSLSNNAYYFLLEHLRNVSIRQDVIVSLALRGREKLPELLTFFKEGDSYDKKGILEILDRIKNPEMILPLLDLAFESNENKHLILPFLSKYPYPVSIPYYFQLLKENDLDLKKHAIALLGNFSDRNDVVNELVSFYQEESSIELSLAVIKALGFDDHNIPYLLEALNKERRPMVRKLLVHLMGEVEAVDAIPRLIEEMSKEPVLIQLNNAARALINIGAPAIPFLLEQIVKHKLPESVHAVYVLGKIGDTKGIAAVQALKEKISDSGVYVLVRVTTDNSLSLKYIDAVDYALRLLQYKNKVVE